MSDSSPRVPWCYRFVRDNTGQTATVGVALLLVITVAGTGAIIALGTTTLGDTQASADIKRAEHTMTLLDSRGAITALGDTDAQRIDLGSSGGGTYDVRPDSGWIRITHANYSANESGNETIYNASLGAVTYTNGDATLAYEGGGVWRSEDNGTSMVSPPEFHYRDSTLTLPIISVNGSGASSGQVSAHVKPVRRATQIYPNLTAGPTPGNETGAPYDGSDERYLNPVENGSVVITVHSDHYRGWATYFRTRTEGIVSVDHDAQTVSVELQTLGMVGNFRMPDEGNSVRVRGMAGNHSLNNYSLTLVADPHFQNLHWSMYHDSSDHQFEVHFY
ncbi:MAG: DUF7289 family protein, partial [Halobacteriota archaeon]